MNIIILRCSNIRKQDRRTWEPHIPETGKMISVENGKLIYKWRG